VQNGKKQRLNVIFSANFGIFRYFRFVLNKTWAVGAIYFKFHFSRHFPDYHLTFSLLWSKIVMLKIKYRRLL